MAEGEAADAAGRPAWDAGLYDRSFGFVSAFATDMVDLLAPEPGERIVDLGCGTGTLSAAIAGRGAEVIGIDGDAAMVERARALHPALRFEHADGQDFAIEGRADAVFSNAALHWMKEEPARVIACVAPRRSGPAAGSSPRWGRTGTCGSSPTPSTGRWPRRACRPSRWTSPGTFRARAAMSACLEDGGFDVVQLRYFARPTPLDDCLDGLADWIAMFGRNFTDAAPAGRVPAVVARTVALTRERLCPDGRWIADYTRLRFVAVRASGD